MRKRPICWGQSSIYCELLECQTKALKKFLTEEMDQINITHVDCYYEMKTTIDGLPQIFRCNPCYRGKSWFDFISVDYSNAANNTSTCASMLLLWLTFDDPQTGKKKIYALTHPLSNQVTPQWMHLPAWKGDRLWSKAIVVNYDTSVSGTAFVLPGIDPFLTNPADKSEKGKLIMKNMLENKYFVVLPQRYDWGNIGWEDMMI
jgi:hypothetical protein